MSDFCIQKIKFNKNVKIAKIKKHCRKMLGKKTIVISKSNIVVNFPTKCFIAKSYKKEIHPDCIVIIGRLKPSHAKLHGAGLGDIFNKIKNTVSNTISNIFSLKNDFNNKAQSMLTKYGNQQITSISVFRVPISSSNNIVKIINTMSTKNMPYEKLMHLGLVLTITGINIRIEKTEVLCIDDMYTEKPDMEKIPIQINGSITMNELLNNAVNKVGKDKIFHYSAFQNNCQVFVQDVLESNGMYNDEIHKFVFQPMDDVVKNMNGLVPTMANAFTDTKAYINRLIGGNKLNDNEVKLLKQVLRVINKTRS